MASSLSQEERIQLAIRAIDTDSNLSVRKAAFTFDVKRTTLQARINGRRSAEEYQHTQQRLSQQEEQSITRLITVMSIWGWPMIVKFLETLAISLLASKGDTVPLDHNWYLRFLERHPDFKTQWARRLDQSRHDATDYTTLNEWFTLYHNTCTMYGISPYDQYNIDEKGFSKGIIDSVKVIVSIEEMGDIFMSQPGNRE